ncbi:hypothetical protein VM1G_02725 [Cytospora mali]|uniref:Cyanovirin-N domain-containing protein n=1 Tax=Cytospora mali TaxID=578113 RepID=A0A194VUJ1_CYTMA|nr:hypothetical protein VM1G_02725 [Valsa mali]
MKVTTIAAVMATGLTGLASAANGMLKTCTTFSLTGMPTPKGGSMMLSAWCNPHSGSKVFSQVDLNKCFGWDAGKCGFTYPPASGFTDVVGTCSNIHSGDSDFGNNFGCWGPCDNGNNKVDFNISSTVFNVFALNSYIGNSNGHLVC